MESGETPVVVELRVPIPPGAYVLDIPGQSGPIAAVVFPDGDRRFLGTVLPQVPARQEFSWMMKPQPTSDSRTADGIWLQPQGRNLLITMDHRTLAGRTASRLPNRPATVSPDRCTQKI